MSDNGYSIEWLEDKLDIFESEKSALALDMHNRSRKEGTVSLVALGLAALALVFAVLLFALPGKLAGGLFRAGANVDALLTVLGIIAAACCTAAVLLCGGTKRLIAIGIAAAVLVIGCAAILRMPGRVGPLQIKDAEGLASVNRFKLGSYVLTDDIPLENGVEVKSFGGVLNGAGHTVSGGTLHIGNNYGTIKDISFRACDIKGVSSALCEVNRGSIEGVSFEEDVRLYGARALIGENRGRVSRASSGALYESSGECGGIVGENRGSIEYCDFHGVISGAEAGGIAYSVAAGSVSNCINRGSFSGCDNSSGGIAYAQQGGSIEKCFADMKVEGGRAYAVCGNSKGGSILRCYGIANSVFIDAGDCVLLVRSELAPSKLIGFDLENTWSLQGGRLALVGMEDAPSAPIPTEQPTAAPSPTATPEPTATSEPETPAPTLTPQELYGDLDFYPEESMMLEAPADGSVRGSNVNVRKGPSTSYGILVQFDGGSAVNVLARRGDWFFVCQNDIYGWIHKDKLRLSDGN